MGREAEFLCDFTRAAFELREPTFFDSQSNFDGSLLFEVSCGTSDRQGFAHKYPNRLGGEGASGSSLSLDVRLPDGYVTHRGAILGPQVTAHQIDFSELDLQGMDLSEAQLIECNLRGANLSHADLGFVNFQGSNLEDIQVEGSNLTGAILQEVTSGSVQGMPSGMSLGHAKIGGFLIAPGVDLNGADLSGLNLSNLAMEGVRMENARLTGAILEGVDLHGARISGLISGQVIGTPASLPTSYRLLNGYIVGPGVSLSSADLSGQDLSGLNLSQVNLTGVTLAEAQFEGVLSGGIEGIPSSLPESYVLIAGLLVGPDSDLSGQDLSDLDLSSMDLSRVNLTSSILSGADLSNTRLDNAQLNGARLNQLAGLPTTLPTGYEMRHGLVLGPSLDLSGVDFSGLNLTQLNLEGANLTGATFHGCQLDGIVLAGARLSNLASGQVQGQPASLPFEYQIIGGHVVGPGVNLTAADLRNQDLSGLNLQSSNLQEPL